jgi:hypothetical protein
VPSPVKQNLPTLLLLAAAAAYSATVAWTGTGGRGPAPAHSASPAADVVIARVNGVPLTETDLKVRLENDSHEAVPSEERRDTVLQNLILREILAQEAREEGLDEDPKYQEALRLMTARTAAFERQELSELLLAREGTRRTRPTEESARAYFAKHEKRIRTRVHVLMILRRSEAAIVEARSQIEHGKSFEEVAASLLPGLPEGKKPWDLGYLAFHKVPEPWREQLQEMKPGEMSGILRGPNDRFWLVKLVDVKEDADVTFESAHTAILAEMEANKVQHARDDLEKALREKAHVEIVKPVR